MDGYVLPHGFYIPARMIPTLQSYIEDGVRPGDFLQAVLHNDLREACARADYENGCNLPAFVSYLYNEAPGACWGSVAKVAAWVERKAQERAHAEYIPVGQAADSDFGAFVDAQENSK